VRRIKSRSSNILRKEFPELLKPPSLWTHNYYASTIASKETVENILRLKKVSKME